MRTSSPAATAPVRSAEPIAWPASARGASMGSAMSGPPLAWWGWGPGRLLAPGRRPLRREGVVGEGAELVAVVAVAGLERSALGVGEHAVAGVEVVGPPAAHAAAGLEAERLPRVPEGGEPGDGLGVAPPLGAPPTPPAVT